MPTLEGACLCGETKISITQASEELEDQIICHCWDCKQSSGSAFSAFVLAPKKEVTITGPVKSFEKMNAWNKNIVTRTFCSNCGTPLTHTSKAFDHTLAIRSANFRESENLPITSEFFARARWSFIAEIPDANQMKTMP